MTHKANLTELHLLTNFEIMRSTKNSKINFFFEGARPNLQNRNELRKFINYIFRNEKKRLNSINYIFTTDKKLLKINKEYLKHDFFTDIVTFEFSARQEPTKADVYMSTDRINDNAKHLGTTFKSEVHRVIFHGALHLCGYADKTSTQKKEMRQREDFYLSKYFSHSFT
jgi:rRNA maturation RNase YbeY